MNYTQQQALKAELQKPAYTALATAQEKADAINTNISTTKFKKVEYNDVVAYLTFREKINGILAAEATNDFAREILFLSTKSKLERFDLNQPYTATSVNRLLDGLTAAGLIDSTPVDDKSNILSLANMTVAEALGLGTVKDYDVTNAEAAN